MPNVSHPPFSLVAKNKWVRFAHYFQGALAPMAVFDVAISHIENLLPLGGKHILSSEPPDDISEIWTISEMHKKQKERPALRGFASNFKYQIAKWKIDSITNINW